jgi:hypothetical protein
MRSLSHRVLVLGGALAVLGGCATSEEWAEWRKHPAHFASGQHAEFSVRNRQAPPLDQTPEDVDRAKLESWWGGPFEDGPLADINGRWVGVWAGWGVMTPRRAVASAEFEQYGRHAEGRLVLEDTLAADVPWPVRLAGSRGVPVVLLVKGSRTVVLRHEKGVNQLAVSFTVQGDRLIGRVEGTERPAVIVLTRAPEAAK